MPKITTSGSRLDAREVEVVGVASKLTKRTTGLRLEAREVEVVGDASKRRKHHLRLVFGYEAGGGDG